LSPQTASAGKASASDADTGSSEKRSNETHRHPPWNDGTGRRGPGGISQTHCESDESP
jgi:hypothetical protein